MWEVHNILMLLNLLKIVPILILQEKAEEVLTYSTVIELEAWIAAGGGIEYLYTFKHTLYMSW